MRNSGGRRVMRSINIDMSSIRFADTELLSRLRQSELLQSGMADETGRTLEGEAVTNLDLYMRYIQRYIEHHPRVRHTMLTLVRQLQPSEWGLPVQLYFFSANVNWVPYEQLQSEVLSHVIALAPLFDLRIYQAPTGADLQRLGPEK